MTNTQENKIIDDDKTIYKIEDINTYKYFNDNELNKDDIINKVIFILSLGKMGIIKKLTTRYIYIIPFIDDIYKHVDNNIIFMTMGESINYYKFKNVMYINKKDKPKQEKILLSTARNNNIILEYDINIFYSVFMVEVSNYKHHYLRKMVHCNKIYDEMFNNAFKRDVRNLKECLNMSKGGEKEYYNRVFEERKDIFINHYSKINYKTYENLINDIDNEIIKKLVNDIKDINILES
jgi:hypothetical protein